MTINYRDWFLNELQTNPEVAVAYLVEAYTQWRAAVGEQLCSEDADNCAAPLRLAFEDVIESCELVAATHSEHVTEHQKLFQHLNLSSEESK